MLGINLATISAYEKEKSFPSFENVLKLSKIFSVSLDEFVYKDIEVEGTSGTPREQPGNEADKAALLEEKIQMLEKQIALYDKLLEQQDPDWGKRSGLED